ncbi:hypothetical protein OAL43_03050 [bacterium]|nr:hypothetical protein [bacterium]
MRATIVVRLTPRLNHRLSLGKRSQFFTGKTFVSEATVKALHLSVLPRAAWFDAGRSYIDAIQEFSHSLANEFGAVVTENELWRATDREHINQCCDEVVTCELSIHLQRDALACKLVDQRKDLQRADVHRSIEYEVDRPNMVWTFSMATPDSAANIAQTSIFLSSLPAL